MICLWLPEKCKGFFTPFFIHSLSQTFFFISVNQNACVCVCERERERKREREREREREKAQRMISFFNLNHSFEEWSSLHKENFFLTGIFLSISLFIVLFSIHYYPCYIFYLNPFYTTIRLYVWDAHTHIVICSHDLLKLSTYFWYWP